jgi:hypothetical protein
MLHRRRRELGKVTFGMMTSLDGYINDRKGGFDWGHVSEEAHRFAEKVLVRFDNPAQLEALLRAYERFPEIGGRVTSGHHASIE